MPTVPALRNLKQDCCEFKASLGLYGTGAHFFSLLQCPKQVSIITIHISLTLHGLYNHLMVWSRWEYIPRWHANTWLKKALNCPENPGGSSMHTEGWFLPLINFLSNKVLRKPQSKCALQLCRLWYELLSPQSIRSGWPWIMRVEQWAWNVPHGSHLFLLEVVEPVGCGSSLIEEGQSG